MEQQTDLKKMVEDLSAEVHLLSLKVNKIHRKMVWASVYGVVKLAIIIIPLIIGYYYLQPEIQKLYRSYGQITGAIDQLGEFQSSIGDNQQSLKKLQELQKQYPQLR